MCPILQSHKQARLVMKIIDMKAFEEAQWMSQIAVGKAVSKVSPKAYWESAMLALAEAYGRAVNYDQ